jgi:hypothetical protein
MRDYSALTKPAVGVFDLASNVSEGSWVLRLLSFVIVDGASGIRNTTTVFDKPERDRVRPVGGHRTRHCHAGSHLILSSQDTSLQMVYWWYVSRRGYSGLNSQDMMIPAIFESRSTRPVLDEGPGTRCLPERMLCRSHR